MTRSTPELIGLAGPGRTRRPFVGRLGVVGAVVVAIAAALPAQIPDPKKPADPPKAAPAAKDTPKTPPPVGLRLPDGTFLWTGPGTVGEGERVMLTPQEFQKLLDQIDQLKKQLAARKAPPPSGCAIRGKVEKRGETTVAVLKATYTVRTATPNAAVPLGGKRAFLVAATLDGGRLPVLDAGEDGFVALVETPGDHTLVLDLEAPVAGRGTRTEVGFELGLPRAAITTLALDPPAGDTRVTLTTRAADPGKPADARRTTADLRQPVPLGAVDSVEVSWDPPAAAPAAETVRAADLDVTCLLAEGFVETTAKVRLRGPDRTWRLAAPADAVVSVDRSATGPPPGPGGGPVVTRPTDPNKPVWKIDLPVGTTAADWVVTAVVRTPRPKAGDPRHKGPFPVGPVAVLDIARQAGTVRVTTAANTRLVVRHGPDLRQDVPPAPAADDETAAFFRFDAGPSGGAPPADPLLRVEAHPLPAQVAIRPTYKLTLTEPGWRVRAELRVFPIRTAVDQVTVELPAGWPAPEASPPEVVDGVEKKADGPRPVYAVRLAAEHRQPFDLVLTATVPVPPAARAAAVPLPRYPNATERDAAVTAAVPDGLEVRGVGHDWDGDQPAAWGQPLAPVPGPDGKPPKVVAAVTGKVDRGLARVDLAWSPYHPELAAEIRADVTVRDSQLLVVEQVKLRSPDGFPKPVRFRGGPDHLKALAPFDPLGPGEWAVAPATEAKDVGFPVWFAVPLPPRPADGGPRRVPVGLLWPAGATRTDALVRVWAAAGTGRTVGTDPGPWRQLPPEPALDRDALPALTLAGPGGEAPLVLEVGDSTAAGAARVWVERGLVQARAGDDGTTYRARFLLKRWLTDSVEVHLPETLVGAAELFLAAAPEDLPKKVAASPAGTGGTGRVVRVPLPEAQVGHMVVLEVRYQLPPAPPGAVVEYQPPRPEAAFAGPVRWRVAGPAGSVPLVAGEGRADQRWHVRSGLLAPVAPSAEDLDRWFQTGTEGDDGAGDTEAAAVQLAGPEAVRVYHVPRAGLVIGASVVVLLVGLVVARLPGGAAGPVVAAAAGAVAVVAVLYPQPAAQAAGAAVPGFAALGLILVGQVAARWYYRRRVTYLPGFTRGRPGSHAGPAVVGGSASVAAHPSRNGSTGPAEAGVPAAPQPAG